MQQLNEEFWQEPPWQGAKRYFRLGLQPIDPAEWLRRRQAADAIAHAEQILEDHYRGAVPARPHTHHLQSALLEMICGMINQPCRCDYPDPLATLTRLTGDDVCIVDVNADLQLVAACVTSPSYWDLREKIDKPLREVHSPVAGVNAQIGASIDRFFRNIPLQRAFARENWFVHADADRRHLLDDDPLSRPRADWPERLANPRSWVVRSERQALLHFTPGYVAFFIRVICEPLAHLFRFPRAMAQLCAVLEGFSTPEIAHFGRDKYDVLREHLMTAEF